MARISQSRPDPSPAASPADRAHVEDRTDLDPRNWEAFRGTCHRALDDIVDFVRTARDRPVWQSVPAAVRERLTEACPRAGVSLDEVYDQFHRDILPYPAGNIHPRFWGWVIGSGTADGMLADMLAAGMNCNVPGYDQAAVIVERQVLRWFQELFGFPDDASGLLVTGGTMANYIGVAVARNARAPLPVRQRGMQQPGMPTLTVYGSVETHGWATRSCELLGLGAAALRRVPIDEAGRIDVPTLRMMLAKDRAAACHPICLIGNAGTVNTGAVDPLDELARLARAEGVWFHVDGALGALAYLAPQHRARLKGLEQADSLAFDLHKWGYLPYDVGCVIVRHAQQHRDTFSMTPSYLTPSGRGVLARPMEFHELGPDLSRSFRALKVWFALKHHGVEGWSRAIDANLKQAQYLAARVDAEPKLERVAPVMLNIVAFRFLPPRDGEADAVNQELMLRLQERGIAVVTATEWRGRLVLRAALANHRTTYGDLDRFVDAVVSVGSEIVAES